MRLVFGGAYQGKLDYVKEKFFPQGCSVCDCSSGCEPEFSADVIYGIDGFVINCVKTGEEAVPFFEAHKEDWVEKTLILTDVSSGIVPMDKDQRAFREMNGRLMLYLAGEADEVIRIFCGLGKYLKGAPKEQQEAASR